MAWKRIKTWVGGYVRQRVGADGVRTGPPVYVIEKMIDGASFHVSTRCNTESAAVRQLARFQSDPSHYSPAGEARVGLRLSVELVMEYHHYQLAKGLTLEWAQEMTRCLADWLEALGAADLKNLSLHDDLKPALASWPKRRAQRVKALRGFMTWLRIEKGLLGYAQDGSIDLKVPVRPPAKFERRRVVDAVDVRAVLCVLPDFYRDLLHLLTATAWHISEARRFVESGEIVESVGNDALAVLMTRHKSGEMHRTRIDHPEHLATARRLLMYRGKPWPKRMTIARVMHAACKQAEVPVFQMGVMRHSVLTWGYELGGKMGDLRDFAGHKSETTTRKFYVDAAVPNGKIPVLQLL